MKSNFLELKMIAIRKIVDNLEQIANSEEIKSLSSELLVEIIR